MNEAEKLINNLYGKGTIGFTCDSCGRETNGCNIVNGMKFCAKCYQETFGKNNQQNEIQELKQQLEALMLKISKQEVEQHDLPDYCTRTGTDCTNLGKIEELQRQLVKKEKEIEDWKQKTQTFLNRVSEQNYEIANNNPKQLAIQELEKVKVNLKDKILMMKNEEHSYLQKVVTWYDICDQINNQIKELKGENK